MRGNYDNDRYEEYAYQYVNPYGDNRGARQRPARKRRGRAFALIVVLALAVAGSFYVWRALSGRVDCAELSNEQIIQILSMEENRATGSRAALVDNAMSLLGEVHYFWGGKSLEIGKDVAWGELREVTSAGSDSTGSKIPYGLDCSGFVAWCFRQSGYSSEDVTGRLGLGTYHQWENSTGIDWEDLQPGDLAFQNDPFAGGNHVGICIGSDAKDEPAFVHCNTKYDNVSVTYAGDVFKHARRPLLLNAG